MTWADLWNADLDNFLVELQKQVRILFASCFSSLRELIFFSVGREATSLQICLLIRAVKEQLKG